MKSPQSEGGLEAPTFVGSVGWKDEAFVLGDTADLEPAPGEGPASLGIAPPPPGGGGRIPTLPLPKIKKTIIFYSKYTWLALDEKYYTTNTPATFGLLPCAVEVLF